MALMLRRPKKGMTILILLSTPVRLSPSVFHGRSLTAVAVAAHEIGHAIAHEKQQAIARLSSRYLPLAHAARRITAGLLIGWPLISMLLHLPYAVTIHAMVVGLSGVLAVLVQIAILPGRMGCQL